MPAGLAMGRRIAESRMTTTCTVTRAGDRVWNPATKQYDETTTTLYDGKCRVRQTGNQDHGATAADQVFIESQYVLHLPVDGSEGIRKDDTVLVTACAEDARLVGQRFTVVSVPAASQTTARRFPVRETQ